MRIIAATAAALCLAACAGAPPQLRALPGQESIRPTPFEYAYQAGKAHLAAQRAALALVMFQRALVINPASVAALNAAGAAFDQLRRPDAAMQCYARALMLEPDSPDTLNNMAISAAMTGEAAAAARLIARASALAPANDAIRANAVALSATPSALTAAGIADADTRPTLLRTGVSEITLALHPKAFALAASLPELWRYGQ